jgi:hypothetical protein
VRAEVFVGDLVRAVRDLDADAATTAAIGSLLGLSPAGSAGEPTPASEPLARTLAGSLPPAGPTTRAEDRPRAAPRPAQTVPQRPEPSLGPVPSVASRVRSVGVASPPPGAATARLSSVDPLPRAEPDETGHFAEPEPLLTPTWAATLLAEALGVLVPWGPHDIDGMIALAAAARPLSELRRLRRTLGYGVQLLIDTGPGMTPFAQDCAVLRHKVAGLVGGRGMQVLRFTGSPLRGAGTGPRPWGAYHPPLFPTPVLLVTDLGIAPAGSHSGRAGVREWLTFARALRRERCRPVALVPYPAAQIPPALRTSLNVVEWDRATTVRSVRRVLG